MIGTHVLADLYGIRPERLSDCALLSECLTESALVCGLTPLAPPRMHAFPGGGVTGVILLSESHIALHSYPEYGFMAVDIFSCGPTDPEKALDAFRGRLHPDREIITRTPRGSELG